MKKLCVLKPIVWNTANYQMPCGAKSTGENFVSTYGYGHEEWNNHPSMKYNGRAYFHSEAKGKLLEANGNLCTILIAAHQGTSYIVGVGAQVAINSEDSRRVIAKTLNIYDRWQDVWVVPLVQKKFSGNQQKFLKHWAENYEWIMWSCPEVYFHWCAQPVPIVTLKVTSRQKVVSMFGSYQPISPAVAVDILEEALPQQHPIFTWLAEGDFEEGTWPPSPAQKRTYKQYIENNAQRGGGNRPTDNPYEYLLVEGRRVVNPCRATLQAEFVLYLKAQGVDCQENTKEYIDVTYTSNDQLVITEIKSAQMVGTKYAIRAAIGQLFEYRYILNKPDALLHIVLDEKPTKTEADFVKSLGILLSYRENAEKFVLM